MTPLAPLLVFADDWGRHPSSAQHLVRRLLPARPVTWVNTIGTRKPRLDLATVKRGFEKLRHWSRPSLAAKPLPANLRVLNPRMWPWFSHAWDRRLNRWLLTRALRPVVTPNTVAVTTLPLVADLIGRLPVVKWVYYCVDDFSVWPGLDGDTLRRMEERLIAGADRIVVVSETLRRRVAGFGKPAGLLTHGVDLDFWRSPGEELTEARELAKPLIVFWGVIDRRMDSAFVRRLADERLGTILLVGPQQDPDPAVLALPDVVVWPAQPLERLPALARSAAVLVMPYADLPVTRAMQPLKLKEYLATGLPVVVRDLPANREWAECMDVAATPEAFAAAVRRCLAEGVTAAQREARRRLEREGWDAKAEAFAAALA